MGNSFFFKFIKKSIKSLKCLPVKLLQRKKLSQRRCLEGPLEIQGDKGRLLHIHSAMMR